MINLQFTSLCEQGLVWFQYELEGYKMDVWTDGREVGISGYVDKCMVINHIRTTDCIEITKQALSKSDPYFKGLEYDKPAIQ